MSESGDEIQIPLTGEALQEVCEGIMLAELAITDNNQDTLKKVSKTMPWHLEAIKLITGSEDLAHEPLTTILERDMNGLILDRELDIRGITKGGHFLDTQGYIAHNDDIIVVSFRCTTSAFDWLTNLNTTSSAWEIEEDLAQGFSGYFSGFNDYWCCLGGGPAKPRVHTGFYNNFLAALPDIQKYVDPLLKDTSKPRKLFVVGHSLGAGIATVTGCYFMTEYDWSYMEHELVIVTAGSPRAVCTSMKTVIDEKRKQHGIQKCRVYRVVNGIDLVARVPPKVFGFCHLTNPIKITEEGTVVLLSNDEDKEADLAEMAELRTLGGGDTETDPSDVTQENDDPQTKYDKLVSRVPKSLRDHMPDFYLKPFLQTLGWQFGSIQKRDEESPPQETAKEPADVTTSKIIPLEDSSKDNKKKRGGFFQNKRKNKATNQ